MTEIVENGVYRLTGPDGDSLIRVLWVARRLRKVCVIDLPGRLPRWLPLAEVEARVADGGLVPAMRHSFDPPSLGDGIARTHSKSPREIKVVDDATGRSRVKLIGDMAVAIKRYDAIAPLVNDPNRNVLFNDKRGLMLRLRAADTGVSLPFLRRSCGLWWTYGQELSSLSGDYHRCGAAGKPKVWTSVPGRRPNGGTYGAPLTDRMRDAFEKGVQHLKQNPELTNDDIHGWLLGEYFSSKVYEDKDKPRLSQTANYIRKHNPLASRHRRQVGPRTHARDFAPHFGTTKDMAWGPGYWEIDGTGGDHELVSELNSARPVGRATIYLVVDVFSRLIMGFYVALRPFNAECASIALMNAMSSKKDYFLWLGIDPDAAAKWPGGVPSNLCSDHGKELLGELVERCGEFHRIGLVTVAPARGDQKGTVENKNSEMKALLRHLPGLVKERGKDRPATRPALTLREYARAVGEVCWTLNTLRPVRNAPPQAFTADGMAPTRLELYAWGQDNRCSPRHVSDDSIRLSLLPRYTVRETTTGFKFRSLMYRPLKPLADVDFCERPDKVWARRKMVIDTRSLGSAWLLDDSGKPCCPCQLTGESRTLFSNVSFDEFLKHEQAASIGHRESGNNYSIARAKRRRDLDQLGRKASARSRKVKIGTSPGGIPVARAHENEMSRPEEAWVQRQPAGVPESPNYQLAPAQDVGLGGCDVDDDEELDLTDLVESSLATGARDGAR